MSAATIKQAWTVDDAIAGRVVINEGEVTIAELFGAAPHVGNRARLMANAPELLEALQFAIRFFDQLTPADAERMRAIVAKATGAAA